MHALSRRTVICGLHCQKFFFGINTHKESFDFFFYLNSNKVFLLLSDQYLIQSGDFIPGPSVATISWEISCRLRQLGHHGRFCIVSLLNKLCFSGFRYSPDISSDRHFVCSRQEGVLPSQRLQVPQALQTQRRRIQTYSQIEWVVFGLKSFIFINIKTDTNCTSHQ